MEEVPATERREGAHLGGHGVGASRGGGGIGRRKGALGLVEPRGVRRRRKSRGWATAGTTTKGARSLPLSLSAVLR